MLGTNTADGIGRAPRGINDGKGFVFISHLGEVFPSGFLPVSAGNVRKQSLTDLYRHSPLFVSLRDSKNLTGNCTFANLLGCRKPLMVAWQSLQPKVPWTLSACLARSIEMLLRWLTSFPPGRGRRGSFHPA